MTSEILIMNNENIIMGADSAVTIGNRKTHTGANKLFGLSDEPPMAMMIFGAATFGSISLESLIKDYKKQTDFEELDDILKIKKSFIEYLKNIPYKISDFEYKFTLFKENLLKKLNYDSMENIIKYLDNYKDEEILPFLENNSFLDVEFEDIANILGNVDIDILKKYLTVMLVDSSSGVVIAGFNMNEFRPSYIYFDLITKYKNEIIKLQKEDTKNAIKKGFKDKIKWYNFIKNEPNDTIALSIINLAKICDINPLITAEHFDATMITRVSHMLSIK